MALRLAGDDVDATHMRAAREFILEAGGIEASRVFTRIWLALFGEWSWDALPAMPPELILLPKWVPLNIYDWACWARQTVVPLTVVATLRPVRPLPFDLSRAAHRRRPAARRTRRVIAAGVRAARPGACSSTTARRCSRRASSRCASAAEWILARQEADGGWGGIQPPWVYSILALHLLGYPLDHPAMRAALEGLEGFLVHEQTARRPGAPARGLPVAGVGHLPGRHRAARRRRRRRRPGRAARRRVAARRGDPRSTGDWAVRRPDLAPGGWAFEFANDGYPDIDDTAEVVLALRPASRAASRASPAAIDRGIDWVVGMQCATAAGAPSTPTTPDG